MASAFTMSDSLADLVWDPQSHAGETEESLTRLFAAAVDALSGEAQPT
jgi:hypothetical protein